MNKTKRWGGKIAVVLCSVLLGMQTGCLFPGKHGGPPGLPPLPGLPRVELPAPSGVPAVTTAGEHPGHNESGQLVRNEQPANATIAQGESHE